VNRAEPRRGMAERIAATHVCPTCHAEAHELCRSRNGKRMSRSHDARARLARSGCAPVSVTWCAPQSMNAWRRAMALGHCIAADLVADVCSVREVLPAMWHPARMGGIA